jgi:hypothetical protein
MNLDTLISEANPAPLAAQPDADSALGRAIAAQVAAMPPHAKKRPVIALAGLVAAAAVGVLVVALLPGSPARPTSAAAAVLHEAATAAANQKPLQLGPGQYLYSETSTLTNLGEVGLSEAGPIYVTYKTDGQFWEASDGSARTADSNIGPVQFTTPQSEANWVAAGSPPTALWLPPYTSGATKTTFTLNLPAGEGVPPLDVSKLPTDPSALLVALEQGVNTSNPMYEIGTSGFEWNPNPSYVCWTGDGLGLDNSGCTVKTSTPGAIWNDAPPASSAASVFQEASELLSTPETGITPELRSALYQVMANLNGVTLLGQQTDQTGRTGTGIASPLYDGLRTEVIIDTTTGDLLQVEQVVVDPTEELPGIKTYFGATAGQVLGWTDYLTSGVVDSTTATP